MIIFAAGELYFVGCDIDCFVNINGRKYEVQYELNPYGKYAMKPGSKTIAQTTSTSMIIRYLEYKNFILSKMTDEIIPPRYNWRTDSYETLGRISQRLYLLQSPM